jgi:glycosyltransferase involved in cell wall biosynthesis
MALCREKAIKLPKFALCPLETRRATFYELLVNLLQGHAQRQAEIVAWPQFAALPIPMQAELLRLMASKAIAPRPAPRPDRALGCARPTGWIPSVDRPPCWRGCTRASPPAVPTGGASAQGRPDRSDPTGAAGRCGWVGDKTEGDPLMRIAIYHNLPSGRRQADADRERPPAGAAPSGGRLHPSPAPTTALCRPASPRSQPSDLSVPAPGRCWIRPWGRLNQGLRLADLAQLRRLGQLVASDIRAGGYDVVFVHACQFEKAPSVLACLGDLPSVYYCQEPLRVLYEPQPARPYGDDSSPRRTALKPDRPAAQALPGIGAAHRPAQHAPRHPGCWSTPRFMQQVVGQIYQINPQLSYHGIDAQRFTPLELAKERFVLSVGSLTPLKGFDFLIDALAELPAAQRPPLAIASNFQNPPERAYLEQLAAQKQVSLQLLGSVDDAHLVELYNQALMTLYAPVREPFGLAPLESMACATPVVAVQEGGIPETVLPEQTGLLVQRDPQQFAAAVQRLLADPELATAYGQAGRQHILLHWTGSRLLRLWSST